MRQQFDLVVLCQPANRPWFNQVLAEMQPGLGRFVLHDIDWQDQLSDLSSSDPVQSSEPDGGLSPDVLARSSLVLRRYDAVLISVSVETLGWTRQCLASLPRGATIPVIGLVRDLRSGALLDLLELGLTEFLRTPICPHETRARLIATVSRAPRQTYLREESDERPGRAKPRDLLPIPKPKRLREVGAANLESWASTLSRGEFSKQKKQVLQIFEQAYLRSAMERAGGRITVAARNSNKNRRAFWELLRKHDMLKEWPSQRQ